jgi:hypothetical protein
MPQTGIVWRLPVFQQDRGQSRDTLTDLNDPHQFFEVADDCLNVRRVAMTFQMCNVCCSGARFQRSSRRYATG